MGNSQSINNKKGEKDIKMENIEKKQDEITDIT